MNCHTCGCPGICTATVDDHLALGEGREIVGCTPTAFLYGKPLKEVPDYWRYQR